MASLVDRPLPAWLRAMFRAPAPLFRMKMGWLFGGRLVMLSHIGRRSGLERTTVLEVVSFEPDPPTWFVASAWGERADWYRNLIAQPQASVTAGRRRYDVTAGVVGADEAVRVHTAYVRNHPWAARMVGRMVGIDLIHEDPTVLADRLPLVALRATPT